jgi:hypothetical protein
VYGWDAFTTPSGSAQCIVWSIVSSGCTRELLGRLLTYVIVVGVPLVASTVAPGHDAGWPPTWYAHTQVPAVWSGGYIELGSTSCGASTNLVVKVAPDTLLPANVLNAVTYFGILALGNGVCAPVTACGAVGPLTAARPRAAGNAAAPTAAPATSNCLLLIRAMNGLRVSHFPGRHTIHGRTHPDMAGNP